MYLLHFIVKSADFIGASLKLGGYFLNICFDIFLVFKLVLKACPEVHSDGAELHLDPHKFFLVH